LIRAQAELRKVPPALQAMLTKGRAAYDRAVRAMHWGEGPIYVLASPARIAAALATRYAFEDLLGWPVEAHQASSFVTASLPTLKTGSIVILIAADLPDVLDLSKALTKQGAQVLAVTAEEALPSRRAGPALLLPRAEGISSNGPAEACLEHARLGFMALIAARLLKSPSRSLERQEKEWSALPRHFGWIADQPGDAVHSFAARLQAAPDVIFVGEGPYHAVALRAARFLRREDRSARAFDLAGLGSESLARLSPDSAVVFVSGSHCTAKRAVAELAARIEQRGLAALAITDSNDRALIRQARLSLLVPDAGEAAGPVLALGLAAWVACEAGAQPRLHAGGDKAAKGNLASRQTTD
jgi:DNA-binding MurR/RpiR family transcriptional regulator